MEAKAAFETLVDDSKRAEYDRRLRLVSGWADTVGGCANALGGWLDICAE